MLMPWLSPTTFQEIHMFDALILSCEIVSVNHGVTLVYIRFFYDF